MEKEQNEQKEELTYEQDRKYSPQEALELAQKMSKVNFDASIEVHFRLGIDPKKGEQQIRSATSLPHGTGKKVTVAAFVTPNKEKDAKEAEADVIGGEDLIEKIKSSEKTEFDIAVAEPAIMKNLAQIAKILGTRGLMPSPKNETVTDNIKETIQELKKGKISFKNDKSGNIHVAIGKVSFSNEQLLENYKTLFDSINRIKPQGVKGTYIRNISINSTMGPGIKVSLS